MASYMLELVGLFGGTKWIFPKNKEDLPEGQRALKVFDKIPLRLCYFLMLSVILFH